MLDDNHWIEQYCKYLYDNHGVVDCTLQSCLTCPERKNCGMLKEGSKEENKICQMCYEEEVVSGYNVCKECLKVLHDDCDDDLDNYYDWDHECELED